MDGTELQEYHTADRSKREETHTAIDYLHRLHETADLQTESASRLAHPQAEGELLVAHTSNALLYSYVHSFTLQVRLICD